MAVELGKVTGLEQQAQDAIHNVDNQLEAAGLAFNTLEVDQVTGAVAGWREPRDASRW